MGLRQAGTPAGVGAGGVGAEQAWAETRAEGKSFVSLHPPLGVSHGPTHWPAWPEAIGQESMGTVVSQHRQEWLRTALRASKEVAQSITAQGFPHAP